MEVAIMNKSRALPVTLNASQPMRMALGQDQLVQSLGEDLELAVSPAVGRQQLDAEGQKPVPCAGTGAGTGSKHQDRCSLQGPMTTAATRTDSG